MPSLPLLREILMSTAGDPSLELTSRIVITVPSDMVVFTPLPFGSGSSMPPCVAWS